MGIFAKFAAALVSIPASVLGGMTTFLFSAVAVSGIRIISVCLSICKLVRSLTVAKTIHFDRRARFILTAALALGFGATLVPDWSVSVRYESPQYKTHANISTYAIRFAHVFTYEGNNRALLGFFNAIELVMETGFAVTAFLALILNLILPAEIEDEEIPELTANNADDEMDKEEWNRINGGKEMEASKDIETKA